MPTWSVHVHCSDAGAAVEAGLEAGRLHSVRITVSCSMLPAPTSRTPPPTRVLSVWRGRRGGTVRAGGRAGTAVRRRRHPRAVLAAIRGTGRREVVVLPNGALPAQDLIAVGARARADARDVVFLPSSSMVQALAALAVHDAERLAVDDASRCRKRRRPPAGVRFGSRRNAPSPTSGRANGGRTGPRRARGRGDRTGRRGRRMPARRPRSGGRRRARDGAPGRAGERGWGSGSRTTSRPHPGVEVMVYRGGEPRSVAVRRRVEGESIVSTATGHPTWRR